MKKMAQEFMGENLFRWSRASHNLSSDINSHGDKMGVVASKVGVARFPTAAETTRSRACCGLDNFLM